MLDPLPELLYDLAQIAAKQGRHEKAIELYRRYQNTFPSSSPQARAIEAKVEGLHQTARPGDGAAAGDAAAALGPRAVGARPARRRRGGAQRRLRARSAADVPGGARRRRAPAQRQGHGDGALPRLSRRGAADDPERAYARAQLEALQPSQRAAGGRAAALAQKLWWLAAPVAVVAAGLVVGIYFGATADSSSVPQIPVSLHK